MPACKSRSPAAPTLAASDERAVSEVVGFLATFAIVAALLLVAMSAFNDAQERAAARVAEVQADSAAQRVSAVAIDLALAVPGLPPGAQVGVAVELPLDIGGKGYAVKLCKDGATPAARTLEECGDPQGWCASNPCPYVRVEPAGAAPRRQSTFLTSGVLFCTDGSPATTDDFIAAGGTLYLVYVQPASGTGCIALSNQPV